MKKTVSGQDCRRGDSKKKIITRIALLEHSHELLVSVIVGGPYQTDDGLCIFCQVAPNDYSEDLNNLILHLKNCDWRQAKEHIALYEKAMGTV